MCAPHGPGLEIASKLFAACGSGDVAGLTALLEREPYAKAVLALTKDPNSVAGKKVSERTIYAACSKGHLDIVRCLLNAGVDPNVNSGSGTPIYAAAKIGHLDLVKLLVERGADYKNVQGAFSPLFVACIQGKLGIVKYLISRGANPNPHKGFSPPLIFAACSAGHLDVVKYFIEELQFDVNRTSSGTHALEEDGRGTLLQIVCQAQRKDMVTFLLQKGAIITPFIITQCSDIITKAVVEQYLVCVDQGTYHAELKGMCLTEVPWAFFADHSSTLTKIDLQSNSLMALPCQLFQMPALKDLNISKNQLSILCGEEIPWQCTA